MQIKELLLKLKEKLLSDIVFPLTEPIPTSRDYEFDAKLESHEVGNQDIYRLYYVNYHRIGESFSLRDRDNIGLIDFKFKPFRLPNGMTRNEGLKVLSYLIDSIEAEVNTDMGYLKVVRTLNNVLDLPRLGFIRVNEKDENKILNLFIVDGRLLLFKNSEFYSKYFDWYIENVTLEEVKDIYSKYGLIFQDIIWPNKENNEPKKMKLNNHHQ